MIQISSDLQTKAYDDSIDVDDLLDEAENTFFLLSQGNMKKEAVQINPVIQDAIDRIKESAKRADGLSGVPSGFGRITSYNVCYTKLLRTIDHKRDKSLICKIIAIIITKWNIIATNQ